MSLGETPRDLWESATACDRFMACDSPVGGTAGEQRRLDRFESNGLGGASAMTTCQRTGDSARFFCVCVAVLLGVVACDADPAEPDQADQSPDPPGAYVLISPGSAILARGDSIQFIASSNIVSTFTWSSADSSVAIVRASTISTTRATVIAQDRSGDVSVCAGHDDMRGCVRIRVLPE